MKILRYILPEHYEISVSSSDISYSWDKFRVRVTKTYPERYCQYNANPEGELKLYDYHTHDEQVLPESEWHAARPVFFETHSYAFCITFFNLKEGTKPRIVHQNPNVINLFNDQQLAEGYALLGNINFLNEPGHFALQFDYTDKESKVHNERFEFDVVSPKLDTKDDLKVIIQQIRQEYGELVFRYLTLTFQQFEQGKETNNDIIWLSVFKQIIDGYMRAIRFILNAPHNKIIINEEYLRPDRIKRWTNSLSLCYKNDEKRNASKARHTYYRTEQLTTTVDTLENRFVKYTIERMSERLGRLLHKLKGTASDAEYEGLKNIAKELEVLSRNSMFRTIGRFEGFRQESMVLQQRNGYQQVYRYWLLLQNGLNLIDGDTSVGVQPIWKLYELWCFLKIKRYVMELLDIDPIQHPEDAQLIKDNSKVAFDPFSGGDMSGKSVFLNRINGDQIEVGYQYKFKPYSQKNEKFSSVTVEQKPDIVLHIRKADGQVLTYLYDAKYRVLGDDDPQKQEHVLDEPVPETLNQMHRYRDAIYYGQRADYHFSKEVIGGYILFPGRMDEVNQLRYFNQENYNSLPYYLRSIFEVNIGAFPLLPNENSGQLLRRHLDDILNRRTPIQQIEGSVPQRGLQYVPQGKEGVLLVMMENWVTRSAKLQGDKLAVPVKMTEQGLDVLENIHNIRYLLFHHRASYDTPPQERDQHLFRVVNFPRTIKPEDVVARGLHPTSQSPDAKRYIEICVDFTQELSQGANLNCSYENLPYNPKSSDRYDAQFVEYARLI